MLFITNFLIVFSNNPRELERLEEEKSAVLFGSWQKGISAGGCHLYEEERISSNAHGQ